MDRNPNDETNQVGLEDLVPLSLVAAELGESIGTTEQRFVESVTVDDVGLRAVPAGVVREFFEEQKARQARVAERRQQQLENKKPTPVVPAGIPAVDDQTAFEALAGSDGYMTVAEEFGRPAPNFLAEELAQGARAEAERREKARVAREKRTQP